MRPDKKKKVHHDSQKAKNRALASNNNSGEDKKPKIKKTATHIKSINYVKPFYESPQKRVCISNGVKSKLTRLNLIYLALGI